MAGFLKFQKNQESTGVPKKTKDDLFNHIE